MRCFLIGTVTALGVGVAGCGGGGNGAPPSTYEFVAPSVNFARNYSQTITDNMNNTITESFQQTVTSVNADGSYVVLQEDTTGGSIVVDGTTYSIPTETIQVNNQSQDTAYTALEANGDVESCSYAPHGPGPGYPLTVSETWSIQYTLTCGTSAPVSYTQSGNVLDVESVTVPAGTYTAIKLQSVISWTTPAGATITETVVNWRDTATLFSVKQSITRVYGGTVPSTGYEVAAEIELQSEN